MQLQIGLSRPGKHVEVFKNQHLEEESFIFNEKNCDIL